MKNLVFNCVDDCFAAANVLLLLKSQVLSLLQFANFIIIIHVKFQHGIRALHVKFTVIEQTTVASIDLGTLVD